MESYGIVKLFKYDPALGDILSHLAERLLRKSVLPESLTEYIAARTSYKNTCIFCFTTHTAALSCFLGVTYEEAHVIVCIGQFPVCEKYTEAKIHTLNLLVDAIITNQHSETLYQNIVKSAMSNGWLERDIHDIVAICSGFCLFNRYVSGLEWIVKPELQPNLSQMQTMGQRIFERGYV